MKLLPERSGLTSLLLNGNVLNAKDNVLIVKLSQYRIWDKNIAELSTIDIADLKNWLGNVERHLNEKQQLVAKEILKEIRKRIDFLLNVGLNYLSLNRQSATLSGGESQRIRLATQIGSQLVNVLYILDEPLLVCISVITIA